jgi:hypothetical protein
MTPKKLPLHPGDGAVIGGIRHITPRRQREAKLRATVAGPPGGSTTAIVRLSYQAAEDAKAPP